MFKQTVIGLTCLLLGVAMGMGAVSHSQPYLGGSVGYAVQRGIGDDHIDRSSFSRYEKDRESAVGTVYAGYRWHYVGAEVGSGSLFHTAFRAKWTTNGGPGEGEQTIDASYRYWRINGYVPLGHGFDLVPFVGRATVKFTNFEWYACPTLPAPNEPSATNLTTGKQVSPLWGVGLEKSFADKWMVRAEYQRVDRAAEDYWTARNWHNTVQTVSVGIARYF